MANKPAKCKWVSLREALRTFVLCESKTQSARHIKPLHWHVACRLVIEGGFLPDDITPRPPFQAQQKAGKWLLAHDPSAAGGGEATVLGGLKTKEVDVVVAKAGVGPVIAVSTKGTLKAFRNLTNRMEEAVGDCTNLHIAYPALVYGFLQVMRGNREARGVAKNDVAISRNGRIVDSIRRYHDVLTRLAGRDDVRADVTKYEAVALALVDPKRSALGKIIASYPEPDSPLLLGEFFDKLYRQYDQRFIYSAPALETTTRRLEWDPESPILGDPHIAGYNPRISRVD